MEYMRYLTCPKGRISGQTPCPGGRVCDILLRQHLGLRHFTCTLYGAYRVCDLTSLTCINAFYQAEMPVHSSLEVWVDNICNYNTNKNIATCQHMGKARTKAHCIVTSLKVHKLPQGRSPPGHF